MEILAGFRNLVSGNFIGLQLRGGLEHMDSTRCRHAFTLLPHVCPQAVEVVCGLARGEICLQQQS